MSKKELHIVKSDLGEISLPQSKKIDCEKLRTYEGFENISDEDATILLEQLEQLAIIFFKQVSG